jgi:NADH:ubiquinone oxidoreductase subunit 2 (subunit N)
LPAVFLLSSIPKIVYYFIFLKILFYVFNAFIMLNVVFWLSGVGSLFYGALYAFSVDFNLKQFIGFSSINSLGFSMLGLSIGNLEGIVASFTYLFIYLLTLISFFIFILNCQKYIYTSNTCSFVL